MTRTIFTIFYNTRLFTYNTHIQNLYTNKKALKFINDHCICAFNTTILFSSSINQNNFTISSENRAFSSTISKCVKYDKRTLLYKCTKNETDTRYNTLKRANNTVFIQEIENSPYKALSKRLCVKMWKRWAQKSNLSISQSEKCIRCATSKIFWSVSCETVSARESWFSWSDFVSL